MPIFVYRCDICGKETEKIYSRLESAAMAIISAGVPGHEANEGFCTQKRVPAAANFQLRGAGFHANDYPKGKA